ncbi:MAG: hypothetical protein AAGF19_08820, partial [Pseudomonadota bacterium]
VRDHDGLGALQQVCVVVRHSESVHFVNMEQIQETLSTSRKAINTAGLQGLAEAALLRLSDRWRQRRARRMGMPLAIAIGLNVGLWLTAMIGMLIVG